MGKKKIIGKIFSTTLVFLRHVALPTMMVLILTLTLCLVAADSNLVAAQSLSDYFSYTSTVGFSKTQITGNEVFYATVEATANCTNDIFRHWL